MAEHQPFYAHRQCSTEEKLSSISSLGSEDNLSWRTYDSSAINNQPQLAYIHLTVVPDGDNSTEADVEQFENKFTIKKSIADFICPYKFDFVREEFEQKLSVALEDTTIHTESSTLHITYHRYDRSDEDLNLLETKVGDILQEMEKTVSTQSEDLTGDALTIRYKRRHLDYFLAGSRHIKGYCDEDCLMRFVFREDQRAKLNDHIQVIKEQGIRSVELPDLKDSDLIVLKLCNELTFRPSLITINNDSVTISGISEDVNTDLLRIQRLLHNYSGACVTLEKSQRKLLKNKEAQDALQSVMAKLEVNVRDLKWHVRHGRVEIAGRNKDHVRKAIECIETFVHTIEINVNKQLLESEKYRQMKLYLKTNFFNRYTLNVIKNETVVTITCTIDVAEQIEKVARSCDIREMIIETSELKAKLFLKMVNASVHDNPDEFIKIISGQNDFRKIVVNGTIDAHKRLEETFNDIKTCTYNILKPNSYEMLQRMEDEPTDGLFFYKTKKKFIKSNIKMGDIADEQVFTVDVIVCSSPPCLNLTGALKSSVAGSIHQTRGPVREPFEDGSEIFKPGTVKAGLAAGRLKCKEIYHVVMATYDKADDGRNSKKLLGDVVTQCLEKAAENNHTSIAFPAIGTGFRKYPCDVTADVMFNSIVKFFFSERKHSIRRVDIVLQDDRKYKVFNTCRRGRELDLESGKQTWVVDTCQVFYSQPQDLEKFEQHAVDVIKNQTEVKGLAEGTSNEETELITKL